MNHNQKIVLQSLSIDLLRAANARHRGSHIVADRFILESKKRLSELDDGYQVEHVNRLNKVLENRSSRQAEDLLMYSTIIRNRSMSLE